MGDEDDGLFGLEEGLGGLEVGEVISLGAKGKGEALREGRMRLTSRRRENGRQDLKVALLRKLVMKLGQLGSVKLSPKLLSKGLGRGLGLTVPEGALPLVVAEPATVVVDVLE